MRDRYDYMVVGAGLAGLVMAERLSAHGSRCLIVERRNHIGGNCHDRFDRNGLLYHAYGPHYFRTNSRVVIEYLSKFTDWRDVRYRVKVYTRGRYWSFPINLETYRQLVGRPEATSAHFEDHLSRCRLSFPEVRNSEEAMLASVGQELYELFFKGYTQKQWGVSARDLDPAICRRIPVRTSLDDRYFGDQFQALPKNGYHAMFENMLERAKADICLQTDYHDLLRSVSYKHLIYTGPLDEYFDCCWGALPYRSLTFQVEEIPAEQTAGGYFQPALQVNYPAEEPFTRTIELKHISGQQSAFSNIVREFPAPYKQGMSEPYYPFATPESNLLACRYRSLAAEQCDVTFLGRLANYRYMNMDQVVALAIQMAERIIRR